MYCHLKDYVALYNKQHQEKGHTSPHLKLAKRLNEIWH